MTYTVRAGDTLYEIAKRFQVSLSALIQANPQITDVNRISPGQVINIPSQRQQPGGRTYTVQRGDTMYQIAQRFGVSLDALLRANPQISNPNNITPGQVINIPTEAQPPGGQTYTVQRGDTLYSIAQRFGISLNALLAANPQITDPSRISPGQVINIPVSGAPPAQQDIVRTTIPYTYDVMRQDLLALRQRYPFIQILSAGTSVMGRDLMLVRLGVGSRNVHYNGAHHANEWITTPVLVKFIEDYAKAYESNTPLRGFNVRNIYQSTSIWIVPMVNPDGVDIVINGVRPNHPFYSQLIAWNGGSTNFSRWKANIRGVDLNRQYRANWELAHQAGPPGPAPALYAGPAPESEPESRAIANLTRMRQYRLVLAYHTQGEIIFWNYRNLAPPEALTIAREFQRLSGYPPVAEAPEIAGNAGYKDWFILAYRRPGFTIEAGRGVNPLPLSQFPTIYTQNLGILLYAAVA